MIIIPARYGSSRLPGKPLALIKGKSLLYRTWSIAKAVDHVEAIYIATDDQRIADHAHHFSAQVIMTPETCINGTERVFTAVNQLPLPPEIILNLQGDAVLTPPWVIQSLVNKMTEEPSIGLATLATQMDITQYEKMLTLKKQGQIGGTTVVFDKNDDALYFSKNMIPFLRTATAEGPQNLLPVYRHIGLYIYRYSTLKQYLNLQPSPLEITEGLEQLRALENNIPIKIVKVNYHGRTHWAIDSQDDIAIVEKLIEQEGELLT